jgi:hypothetical protein
MYQELINKKVAVLNEIHLNPVTVETFKNIAEGRETGINVKHKAQQTLKRLSIMLTSNTLIWTGIPQEKRAVENRIVCHLGLVESEVLCGEELHPNPIMFQKWFKKLNNWRGVNIDEPWEEFEYKAIHDIRLVL